MSFSELIDSVPILSDKQLREERLDVCKGCEYMNVDKYMIKDIGTCGKCSCVIKLKIAVKSEKCPIGKW
jgi:hypothetical protein